MRKEEASRHCQTWNKDLFSVCQLLLALRGVFILCAQCAHEQHLRDMHTHTHAQKERKRAYSRTYFAAPYSLMIKSLRSVN